MPVLLTQFLKRELADRCRRSPRYSLRAFAKYLDISPAYLSRLLNGSRQLSPKKAATFCTRLGLSEAETARLSSTAPQALDAIYDDEAIDELFDDWCGAAILELASKGKLRDDAPKLATLLNISVNRVTLQLALLKKLGLVNSVAGFLTAQGEQFSLIRSKSTSAARRRLIKVRLDLAKAAIDAISFEERDHSFVTVAMDFADLSEARNILKTARHELMQLGQRSKSHDTVYHLDIALFPVIRSDKKLNTLNKPDFYSFQKENVDEPIARR